MTDLEFHAVVHEVFRAFSERRSADFARDMAPFAQPFPAPDWRAPFRVSP